MVDQAGWTTVQHGRAKTTVPLPRLPVRSYPPVTLAASRRKPLLPMPTVRPLLPGLQHGTSNNPRYKGALDGHTKLSTDIIFRMGQALHHYYNWESTPYTVRGMFCNLGDNINPAQDLKGTCRATIRAMLNQCASAVGVVMVEHYNAVVRDLSLELARSTGNIDTAFDIAISRLKSRLRVRPSVLKHLRSAVDDVLQGKDNHNVADDSTSMAVDPLATTAPAVTGPPVTASTARAPQTSSVSVPSTTPAPPLQQRAKRPRPADSPSSPPAADRISAALPPVATLPTQATLPSVAQPALTGGSGLLLSPCSSLPVATDRNPANLPQVTTLPTLATSTPRTTSPPPARPTTSTTRPPAAAQPSTASKSPVATSSPPSHQVPPTTLPTTETQAVSPAGNRSLTGTPNHIVHANNKPGCKNSWTVTPRPGTEFLAIGDSNLRVVYLTAPNCQVHVFPGATISHVNDILLRSQAHLKGVKHIYLNVGVNDRNCDFEQTTRKKLQTLRNTLTKLGITHTFIAIPVCRSRPPNECSAIEHINAFACKSFFSFLRLNNEELAMDKVHLTYDAGIALSQRITSHINQTEGQARSLASFTTTTARNRTESN